MNIVFLGTPEASVPSLLSLCAAGHRVGLVITRPDRPRGRSGRAVAPPVKAAAVERGLEVFQPTRVRDAAFLERLRQQRPDLLVVVAYGRILPAPVLNVADRGAINVHFSLLPRYRGAAPVQWALAHGDDVTGVTTMQIDEQLDTGDVLLQREIPIEPGEHAPSLERRMARVGGALLVDTLGRMEAGTLTAQPQDPAGASSAPILRRADGEIDPALTAREVEGRIRGFDPWPGVWVGRAGRRVRLIEGRDTGRAADGYAPGQVVGLEDDGLLVACGGGTLLRLTRLQPEGRRVLTARDAVNGRHIAPGDRLERWHAAS